MTGLLKELWKIIIYELRIKDVINLSTIAEDFREFCLSDEIMMMLFQRDFGDFMRVAGAESSSYHINKETGKIPVLEYYKAYYENKMTLMWRQDDLPRTFNFAQRREKDSGYVIVNNASVLVKRCDGDIIFCREVVHGRFNQQFLVYDFGTMYSFENRIFEVGKIADVFYVPKYHPLHFRNVDPQHFYINFKLESLDEIVWNNEEFSFYHISFPDWKFIVDDLTLKLEGKNFSVKVIYIHEQQIYAESRK